MKNRPLIFALSLLITAVALWAAAPKRIVYQGRLSKSGVSVAGTHTVVARILAKDGTALWSSGNMTVTLPATGEFTLVLEPTGINWASEEPRLEITVDGDTLSPTDQFSTNPYSFVADQVADGSVTTAKLAAGAVTDEKVAVGVSASKIQLEGTNGSSSDHFLSAWQSTITASRHLIDGSKIQGTTLPGLHATSHRPGQNDALSNLDRTQISGTAVLAASTFTQVIQPGDDVLALQIKTPSVSPNSINILEMYHTDTAQNVVVFHSTGDVDIAGRLKDKTGFLLPVGAIITYGGSSAPSGWLLCDGSSKLVADFSDLHAVIGYTFGGSGANFSLPDLRGRVALGSGQGAGLTNRTLGSPLGEETHTLSVGEIPNHYHNLPRATNGGNNSYINPLGSTSDVLPGSGEGLCVGCSNQPHNIMQPSLVINFIIKY